MTNAIDRAAFLPQPIHVRVGREDLEINSLDSAIHFIRSLRHDHLGRYAEMLLTQMEAARQPQQQNDAWVAFATWTDACHLRADGRWDQAA
jgi:hypothetical protein